MKSLLSRYLMLLAAVILIGTGCTKIKQRENSVTITETPSNGTPVNVGGKGGNATFRLTPVHEGLNIDSCMLYIKYDASVIPFNGKFDDSVWAVKAADGTPVGTFTGLKPGKYYLYGKGWDLVRSLKVKGGLPYVIPQEQKATTHTLIIPIEDYE